MSGLRDYDVQYKVGAGGTWVSWLTHTPQTEAPFVGERDQSYYFRVQAIDNVDNASAWVEAGPVTVSAVTKYYYHGDQGVAMRQGDVVYYLHSDHLGSTSLTTDISGTVVAETRYLPYGEEHWITGTLVTDFTFTGQRAERGFGLMDYNARYYDPWLGRFVSADTLVPDYANPQALNRYSYVLGNPLRFTDPSGHQCEEGDMPCWEARWYEAHGYSQMDGKWTFTGSYEFWDIGALHEFVRDAQQVNPSVAQWQTDVSAMLSATATSLDYLNFALSAAGVGVEALATAGVEFVDPTIGGGTLAGFAGGAKLYNLALNPIENRLSALAALFVAASDLAAENTYIDSATGELVIGQDTTVSIVSILFGNTALTPEAISDTTFNLILMAYDTWRMGGHVPTFMETRIGQSQNGIWYTRPTAPKPK
jgi:RHS repeat-associated protein